MDNEIVFSLLEAMVYLKEGRIIKSISNNFVNYFRLVKDKIRVSNCSTKYYLSIEEFKCLYKNSVFMIVDSTDEETIDSMKDKEYYSWTHK